MRRSGLKPSEETSGIARGPKRGCLYTTGWKELKMINHNVLDLLSSDGRQLIKVFGQCVVLKLLLRLTPCQCDLLLFKSFAPASIPV